MAQEEMFEMESSLTVCTLHIEASVARSLVVAELGLGGGFLATVLALVEGRVALVAESPPTLRASYTRGMGGQVLHQGRPAAVRLSTQTAAVPGWGGRGEVTILVNGNDVATVLPYQVRLLEGGALHVQCIPSAGARYVSWKIRPGTSGAQTVYNRFLNITEVRPHDAGTYTCQVATYSNSTTVLSVVFTLEVLYLHAPVISGGTEMFEEEEVRLECRVDAFPEPIYQWRNENGIPLQTGRSLQTVTTAGEIYPLSGGFAIDYKCVVSATLVPSFGQAIGIEHEAIKTITVYKRVRIGGFSNSGRLFSVEDGGNVNITCLATGSPPPFFRWELVATGAVVEQGQNLVIDHITKKMQGEYRCRALNSIPLNNGSILETNAFAIVNIDVYTPLNGDTSGKLDTSCNETNQGPVTTTLPDSSDTDARCDCHDYDPLPIIIIASVGWASCLVVTIILIVCILQLLRRRNTSDKQNKHVVEQTLSGTNNSTYLRPMPEIPCQTLRPPDGVQRRQDASFSLSTTGTYLEPIDVDWGSNSGETDGYVSTGARVSEDGYTSPSPGVSYLHPVR
ncbi:NRG-like protein [Mya arenaria]|uniref:NRG-like protein n=1 Tax=Mya arenaria TaxID=6604 RepID=A0ABY7FFR9_MYAAR|nr:NRG-like protein [Mya arenaria]